MDDKQNTKKFTMGLQTRIWCLVGILFVTAGTQITLSMQAVKSLEGLSNSASLYGWGRTLAQKQLNLALVELNSVDSENRVTSELERDIALLSDEIEDRFKKLRNGAPELGIKPTTDPELLSRLDEGEKQWYSRTKPLFEQLISETNVGSKSEMMLQLSHETEEFIERIQATISRFNDIAEKRIAYANNLQVVFVVVYIFAAGLVIWITRPLLKTLGEAISSLGSGASEILASTSQQSTGAKEQAAAVSQTTSTVEELLQSANQTADKAKSVSSSAEMASEIGQEGKEGIEASIDALGRVRTQSNFMARKILELAENAKSIGDFVEVVSEISEQTNILSINAGIEASKAGEHGLGFNVVAREVKELALESKNSMTEINRILEKIRSSANQTVLGVEEESKLIEHSIETVRNTGNIISDLVDTIITNEKAAVQINAASGQQVNAIKQIKQAMEDIRLATQQSVSASKQNEQVAGTLADLGAKLRDIVKG
jgi:methyl-accepting chemotaxis protein